MTGPEPLLARPLRVLTILTYYHPHWTGLTTHAVRVAEGLAADNLAVSVLTTRHPPELNRIEVVNGVRVMRLWPLARFSRGMITPAFVWAAARLIARHDVVHMHTPLPEALFVGLLCRLQGRPLLMTHHGDLVMPRGLGNQLLQAAGALLLHGAAYFADAVTAYNRDYADHSRLMTPFHHKLFCVDPPVDLPPPVAADVAAWRARLGLRNKLVIGFAGRWVEEKGFDVLLGALPAIRAAHPEAHLLFAGETRIAYENFYERCRPLIEAQRDHLTLLGLIRDPQRMANFYALCDLFVQPSRTDMMGLTQIEAMLSGTPVVVSDIPGARVAVRDTGFGRLAPPGDAQALARTIAEALRHRDRHRPLRDTVRARFDPPRTIAQYRGILEGLVAQRRVVAPDPVKAKDA